MGTPSEEGPQVLSNQWVIKENALTAVFSSQFMLITYMPTIMALLYLFRKII